MYANATITNSSFALNERIKARARGELVELGAAEFSKFDLEALPTNTIDWYLGVSPSGWIDQEGFHHDSSALGSQFKESYNIIVLERGGFERASDMSSGLPSSEFIISVIRRVIIEPCIACKFYLPRRMDLFPECRDHVPHAIPDIMEFLRSLPSPVACAIMDEEEKRVNLALADTKSKIGKPSLFARIMAEKKLGDDALKGEERVNAIIAYGKAIVLAELAMLHDQDDEKAITEAQGLLAICYAKRSAAWCLKGPGMDAQKGLEDAEAAIRFDNTHADGHYQQVKAYLFLSNVDLAKQHFQAGLQQFPELQSSAPFLQLHAELVDKAPKQASRV